MSLQTISSKLKRFGLSGNQLKIIAAIAMVCDHIGFYLVPPSLPVHTALRIIGRIAFPVFAYFIAEGCVHSKNKFRYLAMMAFCAVIAEIVFGIANASGMMYVDYSSIFMTFTFGIIAAFLYDFYRKNAEEGHYTEAAIYLAGLAVYMLAIAYIDFYVRSYEYGIGGVLIILLSYFISNRYLKLAGYATGCLAVVVNGVMKGLQSYMLLSVPVMLLYNGKRGKWRMKYFFYIFYPGHIVVILLIGLITGLI